MMRTGYQKRIAQRKAKKYRKSTKGLFWAKVMRTTAMNLAKNIK